MNKPEEEKKPSRKKTIVIMLFLMINHRPNIDIETNQYQHIYKSKYSSNSTTFKTIKIIDYSNNIRTIIFPYLEGAKSIPEISSHS